MLRLADRCRVNNKWHGSFDQQQGRRDDVPVRKISRIAAATVPVSMKDMPSETVAKIPATVAPASSIASARPRGNEVLVLYNEYWESGLHPRPRFMQRTPASLSHSRQPIDYFRAIILI